MHNPWRTIVLMGSLLVSVILLLLIVNKADSRVVLERGQSDCQKYPALATPKGAVKRAKKGWNADKIEKNQNAIERVRIQRRCAPSKKARRHVARAIEKAKSDFKEAKEFRDEITPYYFGEEEDDLEYVAIPQYIVRCETSGYGPNSPLGSRWQAVNRSSGARGPYQMLPSTYYGVCDTCDWSHDDQHLAASRVYDRSGGSEWECA